jgi:mono/diheme cytochrome c family protein
MKTLKTVIITLVVAILLCLGYVSTGWYNVAATDHHNALTLWLMDLALERSVDHHASGLQAPASSQDSAALREGAYHFQRMCRGCHGAPGVLRKGGRGGMYPEPPDFSKGIGEWTAPEVYWIVKNGIKMSGMPSYGDSHSDEDMWAIAAFAVILPKISTEQYQALSAEPDSTTGGEDHH